MKIVEVEGIGPVYSEKLHGANVQTTDDLLETGRTPEGRFRLSETTGISTKQILEWVNDADLMRIKGVGSEYADLLEAAGVDTVVELARRNPAHLTAAIHETNEQKQIVRRPPSDDMVADWVDQAKQLDRVVEY